MDILNSKDYDTFLRKLYEAQKKETIIYYRITTSDLSHEDSMVIDKLDESNLYERLELKDILTDKIISIDVTNNEFKSSEDEEGIMAFFNDKKNNISIVIEFSF